ncbi:MAG: glutamate-cysteine ligase family protein [Candidatus Absconditabacterales bacterium]|nr:glutamate-cysteine ligase family protein [Candidatus Absconditabacterales bacterium]
MKGYTFGIENEVIILDFQGRCVPKNAEVIQRFIQKYPQYANNIKPELDACQVELITDVHESLKAATTQIITLTNLVARIVSDLGYILSKNPAPDYPASDQKTSVVSDPCIQAKYHKIDVLLREKNVRYATNIAGIHINIGHLDAQKILTLHHEMSKRVKNLLDQNDPDNLAFHPQRFNRYKIVVDAFETAMIFEPDEGNYLDELGHPKDQGHSLVRLKKYGNRLVTELRTPRGGYDLPSVIQSIQTVLTSIIIPSLQSVR